MNVSVLEELGRIKESELTTGWVEIFCDKGVCTVEKKDYVCSERNQELVKQIHPQLSKKVPITEELLCKLLNDYYWSIRKCIETDECLLVERIKETIEKKKENIMVTISLVPSFRKLLNRGYAISIEIRDSIYIAIESSQLIMRFVRGFAYPDVMIFIEKLHPEIEEDEENQEKSKVKIKSVVEKLLGDYDSIKIAIPPVKSVVDFINVFHYYSNLFL